MIFPKFIIVPFKILWCNLFMISPIVAFSNSNSQSVASSNSLIICLSIFRGFIKVLGELHRNTVSMLIECIWIYSTSKNHQETIKHKTTYMELRNMTVEMQMPREKVFCKIITKMVKQGRLYYRNFSILTWIRTFLRQTAVGRFLKLTSCKNSFQKLFLEIAKELVLFKHSIENTAQSKVLKAR